jgi:hypothetical protein
MGIYRQLYDFASGAGAFEGYVYLKDACDPKYLPKWADNLVKQYQALPAEVRDEIQALCNGTIGRAIRSLLPYLGDDHEVIKQLRLMIKGELPLSPDDFSKPE